MNIAEVPNECGVYFLYAKGKCIYVGKSIHMANRLKSHNHKGKFDDVQFTLCAKRDLKETEREQIEKLDPPLNKHHTANENERRMDVGAKMCITGIPEKINKAINKLAKEDMRTYSNMGRILIEEALKARGVKL